MTTRRVLKTSLLPTIRETSRTEQYLKVQNEALELFKKKNNDYGDAFATYVTVGIIVDWVIKLVDYHLSLEME